MDGVYEGSLEYDLDVLDEGILAGTTDADDNVDGIDLMAQRMAQRLAQRRTQRMG